jgi:hypothetical protein
MKNRPLLRAVLAALAVSVAASPSLARKLVSFDASASNDGSGVPRLLMANDADLRGKAAPRAVTAAQSPADHEAQARAHLRSLAATYRTTEAQIDALPLLDVQVFPQGGSIVRFRNRIDGIDVFREEVKVLQDKAGNLVAVGGFAIGAQASPRKTTDAPDVTREAAVAVALGEHGFAAGVAQTLAPVREEGGYTFMTSDATTSDGSALAAPVRVKRVWFRMSEGLVPAWYVEVQVRDAATPRDVDGYSYVVSQQDGAILFRHALTADAAFTYRVYAEPAPPFLPLPGPGGRAGYPHPTATPDGFQPAPGPANLVTLDSAPFSKNDPWLTSLANKTQGNNVEAFSNAFSPDNFNPPAIDECNLSLAINGDLHACVTSAGTFDHSYNFSLAPAVNREQVAAGVTNIFYTINYLHDFFYDSGFDEAAGNAQTSNYSRGGIGNDSIFAETQDFTGSNNANMFTPPDGQRPRMRQFLWSQGVTLVKINAPAGIAGIKQSGNADFGAQGFDLTSDVVLAQDAANTEGPATSDGCTALTNAAAVAGKIVAVDRGTCTFVVKANNVQAAGGAAMLVLNNVAPAPINMTGSDATITIPAVSVSLADGSAIKAALAQGAVSARIARQLSVAREGALDNTLIAHEWGHYLSNRLVHNANGIVANQASGMGEGWSDFVALLLLVKEADRTQPANANFNGTYAETLYPLGGPDFAPDVLNNAYYYGIRRYPYTRDMSKNPLTFKHISDGTPLPASPRTSGQGSSQNSEVHNTGEVWASMLWECYSNLLNDTARLTFAQAQERMKRYLVAGLKLTPQDPTFVEARDALLAAMAAQDAADRDLCLAGFAKRGLGIGAVAPPRVSDDNGGVIESFSVTAQAGVKAAAIEYYHAVFDHYFVTDIADEIAKLDNGTFVGWARTGQSFNVYSDAPAGSVPVCRFFSTSFSPKSSHFYTPDAAECASVKANPNWQFEAEVFNVAPADTGGDCPGGTLPVYRMYNNGQGAAPNHRYTTSLATRATMLAKGWIPEGYGTLGVIMCSPQ